MSDIKKKIPVAQLFKTYCGSPDKCTFPYSTSYWNLVLTQVPASIKIRINFRMSWIAMQSHPQGRKNPSNK